MSLKFNLTKLKNYFINYKFKIISDMKCLNQTWSRVLATFLTSVSVWSHKQILPNKTFGWMKENLCKWISGTREIFLAFSGGTGKVIFLNCLFFFFFPETLPFMKHFLKYFIWGKITQKCGNKDINERACFNTCLLIYSLILSMLFTCRRIFSGDLSVKHRCMNYVIKTTDRFCLWLVCDSVECRYFIE